MDVEKDKLPNLTTAQLGNVVGETLLENYRANRAASGGLFTPSQTTSITEQGGQTATSGPANKRFRLSSAAFPVFSEIPTFSAKVKQAIKEDALSNKTVKMHYQVNTLEPVRFISPTPPTPPSLYPAFLVTAGMTNGQQGVSQFIGGTILPLSLRVDYTQIRAFGPAITTGKGPQTPFRLTCIQHCEQISSLDNALVFDTNPIVANNNPFFSKYLVPEMKNFNELADFHCLPDQLLVTSNSTAAASLHPTYDGYFTVNEQKFIPIVYAGNTVVAVNTLPISGAIVVYLGTMAPFVTSNTTGTTSQRVDTYTTMSYLDEI